MRVLLIEDDDMIGAAVLQALKDAAYAVDWVTDGHTAIAAVEVERYDIALLDLGLPKRDGRDVLRRFRKMGDQLPVIIVTARDGIDDRIDGLDLGAILSNGVISLNPATHEVTHGGETSRLTARELALLQALLARPGNILSRSELESQIYGWNEEVESNAVEFLIHGVRKKVGASAIRNVRGVGWMVDRAS
jgi:two-component system OmpR family response regulator